MKHYSIAPINRPILASGNRIGWAVPAGFAGGALIIALMFFAAPDRPTYEPFFTVANTTQPYAH